MMCSLIMHADLGCAESHHWRRRLVRAGFRAFSSGAVVGLASAALVAFEVKRLELVEFAHNATRTETANRHLKRMNCSLPNGIPR